MNAASKAVAAAVHSGRILAKYAFSVYFVRCALAKHQDTSVGVPVIDKSGRATLCALSPTADRLTFRAVCCTLAMLTMSLLCCLLYTLNAGYEPSVLPPLSQRAGRYGAHHRPGITSKHVLLEKHLSFLSAAQQHANITL